LNLGWIAMLELWRIKPYRFLFLAGLLSEFGTFVSEVAILMRIFELAQGKIQYLGLTQMVFLLSMILGTLLGGMLGEGKNKVRVLIACEAIRVPIILLMLLGSSSIWILIAGNGAIAFFSGIFNPTRQALINEILPSRLVSKANGISSTTFAFLHAAGPLVGGTFFGLLGNLSPFLLFDLSTYAIGIFLLFSLLFLPAKKSAEKSEHSDFWLDLKDSFNLLANNRDFFWLIIRGALASLALGFLIPLILPLNSEVLHLPRFAFGLLLGTFGLGGAFGGIFFSKTHKISIERLLRIFLVAESFALAGWTLSTTPLWAFPMAFIYGALIFGRIAGQLNFISHRLPKNFNARANSFVDLSMIVPNVLGSLILAILGAHFSTTFFLRSTAIGFVGFAVVIYLLERKKA
jgi:MFS family permease